MGSDPAFWSNSVSFPADMQTVVVGTKLIFNYSARLPQITSSRRILAFRAHLTPQAYRYSRTLTLLVALAALSAVNIERSHAAGCKAVAGMPIPAHLLWNGPHSALCEWQDADSAGASTEANRKTASKRCARALPSAGYRPHLWLRWVGASQGSWEGWF